MLTPSLCIPIAVIDWGRLSFFFLLLGGCALGFPLGVCDLCVHIASKNTSVLYRKDGEYLKQIKCPGWSVRVQWITTALHFDVLEVSYSFWFQIKSVFVLPPWRWNRENSSGLAQSTYPTNHIRLRTSGQRPLHKGNSCRWRPTFWAGSRTAE